MLIAGTVTPCAMVSLYEVKPSLGITVFSLGWLCALFVCFQSFSFFEKLKAATMVVYIISGVIMLSSVIPVADEVNMSAFWYLVAECIVYLVCAVLCALGIKRSTLHVVFHIFVMTAGIHFYTIYTFIIA